MPWRKKQRGRAVRILPAMANLMFTRKAARSRMATAGRRAKGDSLMAAKGSATSGILPDVGEKRPKRAYSRILRIKGTRADFIMEGMLSYTVVPVREATKRTLVDTGEHRSPKKAPERMDPPRSKGEMPRAFPMAAQMTPMVEAVPKEVPVRKETRALSKKAMGKKMAGRIKRAE